MELAVFVYNCFSCLQNTKIADGTFITNQSECKNTYRLWTFSLIRKLLDDRSQLLRCARAARNTEGQQTVLFYSGEDPGEQAIQSPLFHPGIY